MISWCINNQRSFNKIIIIIIIVSIILTIIQTEDSIYAPWKNWFFAINLSFFIIFITEYIIRLFIAFSVSRIKSLLLFIFSLKGLIDVLAISSFLPVIFLDYHDAGIILLLRLLRIAEIFILISPHRHGKVLRQFLAAIKKRNVELTVMLLISGSIMVISATILFAFERNLQPEQFGSIPRALYWSIITLTSVGYGDVYPITLTGKIFAGITALMSVLFIALPVSILSATMVDSFFRQKD